MLVKSLVNILNAPERLNRYTVLRRAEDGKLWYYGTYKDKDRAEMAQAEIGNGILIEVMI